MGPGKDVVFDIDVKGAMQIKEKYGDEAVLVFIRVPELEMIKQRLIARKTESAESLARRLNRIEEEMQFAGRCDHIIDNIELETALRETEDLIARITG